MRHAAVPLAAGLKKSHMRIGLVRGVEAANFSIVYFVIKNLVLWARSEFSGSAKRIDARV